jgi:hypothetical protein
MLLESNCQDFLYSFKLEMSKHFKMKDLGKVRHFLGMHITQDRSKKLLTVNQSSFLKQILSETQMSDC